MVLRFYTSGLAYSQFDSNVRILGCLIIPAYKANSAIRNSQLEQVQAFSGKLIEFLGEQAEKEVPPMPLRWLSWRALDFVHFTFGKESAERLTLHILKDMPANYDFKQN